MARRTDRLRSSKWYPALSAGKAMSRYRVIPSGRSTLAPAVRNLCAETLVRSCPAVVRYASLAPRPRRSACGGLGETPPDSELAADALVSARAREASPGPSPIPATRTECHRASSFTRIWGAHPHIRKPSSGSPPLGGGYTTNLRYDCPPPAQGDRGARDKRHAGTAPLARVDRRRRCGSSSTIARQRRCSCSPHWRVGARVLVSRGRARPRTGGGFRVPDSWRNRVHTFREVGTTNRTRIADYALAISDRTGAIPAGASLQLQIEGLHRSCDAARDRRPGALVLPPDREDLGSGFLSPRGDSLNEWRALNLRRSTSRTPRCSQHRRRGPNVVCCSGPTGCLGGPRRGLILGRAAGARGVSVRHP
jgi:hypothetical protein